MPRVDVTIHPDGRIEATVSGVPGPGCQNLTALIERALGRASERRPTAERWQRPAAQRVERRS